MARRQRVLHQLDLDAALDAAEAAAARAGAAFEHQIEQRPPATCLVISSPDPATAQVIVSTIEPGTLFVDIGVGLHGEWLLRTSDEVVDALADLGRLFEAVFRGHVEEYVRQRPGGRHSIRGSVTTPLKTYRFRHHALGLSAESGVHRYAPYPPTSG